MKKKKFMIIKDFERYNDDFDIKKTHRQIINYDHYFKSKNLLRLKLNKIK